MTNFTTCYVSLCAHDSFAVSVGRISSMQQPLNQISVGFSLSHSVFASFIRRSVDVLSTKKTFEVPGSRVETDKLIDYSATVSLEKWAPKLATTAIPSCRFLPPRPNDLSIDGVT
ncbi:hypothetical protein BR93DRAFT_928455 [Coniochaeta sp. PMI_546]|nr:hypothetical protein BR93DRAFT_928455 [Coniochaeta sp. PMI_546]